MQAKALFPAVMQVKALLPAVMQAKALLPAELVVSTSTCAKTLLTKTENNLSSNFNYLFSFIDRRLPEYKQRIAGKSIPFEKFSIHKANKYLAQNHRLFLPGMVGD